MEHQFDPNQRSLMLIIKHERLKCINFINVSSKFSAKPTIGICRIDDKLGSFIVLQKNKNFETYRTLPSIEYHQMQILIKTNNGMENLIQHKDPNLHDDHDHDAYI